ncbi:MAG TPA: PRC-barrel domain-containing protein [Candidatus Saccharimonadales bacterium]|nr:PRC-barrel domain-containing protein [Candidatus Saccharimonadales bacterium]
MIRKTYQLPRALGALAIFLTAAAPLSYGQADKEQQEQQKQQSQQQGQKEEKSKDELKVTQEEMDQKVSDVNKASKLVGMEVRNKQDEKIGKLSDLVIDLKTGKVAYGVLSSGGTLGAGGKTIAVPLQAITVEKGKKSLLLDMDKQQLKDAPGFSKNEWPPMNAAETGKTVGLAPKQKSQEASGATGSQSQQSSGSSSSQSASATITDAKELTSGTDASSLEGKQVQLSEAKIKEVLGDKFVTITSAESQQAVGVKTKESASALKPDQKVTLTGKAHKMPQDTTQLGIDQQAAQKLQGQQVYIEATELKPEAGQ